MDRYYDPGERETVFLGRRVLKYHHTLTQILGGLLRTVHESLCAPMRYSFWLGETLLFRHTDSSAGFENSGSGE